MKGKNPTTRGMGLFFSVALVLLLGAAGTAETLPVAHVVAVRGAVSLRQRGAAAFTALPQRQALRAGDVVRTGPGGKASLLFVDGSMSSLNANTEAEITAPTSVGRGKQSFLRVVSGEVWARMRPDGAMQTRAATAGVHGTEFHLRVEADGTTTLTVIEGEVEFFNPFGAVSVAASQQSTARVGSAPTPPVTIENPNLIVEWTLDLAQVIFPRERSFTGTSRALLAAELERRRRQVEAQPGDAAARSAYADALFDAGRCGDALREYQEADRLRPAQAATQARLGYALMELGRLEESAASFQAALGNEPGHAPALTGAAWLALARGKPEDAETSARRALATGASPSEAHVVLGLALMRQPGKLPEAVAAFQAALAEEPASFRYQARAWLALALLAQDDAAGALQQAKEAAQAAPESALARGNLALVWFFNGRSAESEREARAAIRLNPDSAAARCALGQALLARGDVDSAARTAAQAVALDPGLPQAHYLLGVADAQRRDYRHAVRELAECLRLAPDYLPAASAQARVLSAMGRREEATGLLEAMLPRHRHADQVQAALGMLHYHEGSYGEAERHYREALRANPDSALYHAEMARVLLDSNRLNEAIRFGQQAVRLAPEVGQYHAVLGLAYDYGQLGAQADREYRSALAVDPRNALAHLALGLRASRLDAREHRVIPKRSGQSLVELLRQGQQASGSGPALSSITQAFLYDPAISTQLMRGGIGTELTPTGGNATPAGFAGTNRLTAFSGRLHSLALGNRDRDDGPRANDDARTASFSENATWALDPRTVLFARGSIGENRQGLPGSTSAPTPEDRANAENSLFQLAARRRIGSSSHLWVGLTHPRQRYEILDPGLDSWSIRIRDAQGNAIKPTVASQVARSRGLVPEARLELGLSRRPARTAVLTVGAAQADLTPSFDANLLWAAGPPAVVIPYSVRLDGKITTAYAQMVQQAGRRLSLASQLRYQKMRATTSATLLGGGWASTTTSRAYLLPSLLASYQMDRRTAVRLIYNQQAQEQELMPAALAPLETLLTAEPLVMPKGMPNRTETVELDVERCFTSRDLARLFLFSTGARGVAYGDLPSMERIDRFGVGLRYERQLGRDLFIQAGWLLNHSRNRTLGTPFDRGTAPYHPMNLGGLGLNYLSPTGTKVGFQLSYTGRFFQDTPSFAVPVRPVFPARTYLDLTLAREPTLGYEVFLKISNLLNSPSVQFNGFPTGQRRIVGGATARF